jgi:hypothetical protein
LILIDAKKFGNAETKTGDPGSRFLGLKRQDSENGRPANAGLAAGSSKKKVAEMILPPWNGSSPSKPKVSGTPQPQETSSFFELGTPRTSQRV